MVTPARALAFLIVSVLAAQDTGTQWKILREQSVSSLRGLGPLDVTVSPLPPIVREHGLSSESIERDVRLQLEQSGIRLTQGVTEKRAMLPRLEVSITLISWEGVSSFLTTIYLSVRQETILYDDRSTVVPAITWTSRKRFYRFEESRLRHVREQVSKFVGEFIATYRSQNPAE